MIIIDTQTFYTQEGIIESIGNILEHLVGVKDWILWIEGRTNYKTIHTSSIVAQSLLRSFQEVVDKQYLFLAQGNYLSVTSDPTISHKNGKILILPICHEGKLLGAIGLYSEVKSWGQTELSILQSIIYQWGVFVNQIEVREKEIENRILCDVIRKVNEIIRAGSCLEEIITSIISLTQEKLQVKEIILYRMVGKKEVAYLIKSKRNLKFNSAPPVERENNYINMPLCIGKNILGRLVVKSDKSKHELSREELDILKYIQAQLTIILDKIEEPINNQENQKNEHLSHIHHELRTPLVAILGFSRMLNEEIYGTLNQKQKQYVQGIVTSGEHLLDLVNNFLDMFKIDANQEELFWEILLVEEICQSALCMVQPVVNEKGLQLNLETDPELNFCQADRRRLKQILVNLLSNAVKFTTEGSVTLKVQKQNNNILFSIVDTGVGINASEQNKLFQPFRQIKSSLNRKYKGTGLGLALSLKLARLHGGEITIVSEEGRGSCFTLHLPIK